MEDRVTVDYREGKHNSSATIGDVVGRYSFVTDDVMVDQSAPAALGSPENGMVTNLPQTQIMILGESLLMPIDKPSFPMFSSGVNPDSVVLSLEGRALVPGVSYSIFPALQDQVVSIQSAVPEDLPRDGYHTYQASLVDRAGHAFSGQSEPAGIGVSEVSAPAGSRGWRG